MAKRTLTFPSTTINCQQSSIAFANIICHQAAMSLTHLVGHDHGGASVHAQHRKLGLDGQEVENLCDGLLVGAVGEDDAVEARTRQQLAYLQKQKAHDGEP